LNGTGEEAIVLDNPTGFFQEGVR